MNDYERASCYAAEEAFVALGLPEDVEGEIEEGWTSGRPQAREAAARLLLKYAPTGSGIDTAAAARSLLRRLYRC